LQCYLIRTVGGSGVLGIFWAESVERLWWLVDQANADPASYEYAALSEGFLAFTGETEPQMPVCQFDWSGAEASDSLFDALTRPDDLIWTRFPAAGEPGSGLPPVTTR
jgi:hypothetical protein